MIGGICCRVIVRGSVSGGIYKVIVSGSLIGGICCRDIV